MKELSNPWWQRVSCMVAVAFISVAMVLSVGSAQTLRLAHHHAMGGTVHLAAERFAHLVEQRSGGRVTVQVFPAAQLGQELEAFDLLDQGLLDLTITSLGLMDKYWYPMNVTSLPFVYRDWDHVLEAFAGEYGDALRNGMANNSNVELLGFLHLGFRHMLFRKEPITRVSEMRGLRMRSPEQRVWIRMFELLGARPTPVTWGEVYTAMQTGVAAGLESPAQAALDMHFDEVIDSLVLTNHMFGSMSININQRVLQRLAPELREIVRTAAEDAAEWANNTISLPAEDTAMQTLKDRGVLLVEPEDPGEWATAMKPLWAEVIGQNRDAQQLLDMLTGSN
jgi:tripartite ATP-independent transporter DctP family solute receptor